MLKHAPIFTCVLILANVISFFVGKNYKPHASDSGHKKQQINLPAATISTTNIVAYIPNPEDNPTITLAVNCEAKYGEILKHGENAKLPDYIRDSFNCGCDDFCIKFQEKLDDSGNDNNAYLNYPYYIAALIRSGHRDEGIEKFQVLITNIDLDMSLPPNTPDHTLNSKKSMNYLISLFSTVGPVLPGEARTNLIYNFSEEIEKRKIKVKQ